MSKPFEMIPVGQLEVLAYTPVDCPNKQHLWNLSRVPVMQCAYYLAARDRNPIVFDEYIGLWAIRVLRERGQQAHTNHLATHTYATQIAALADQIKSFGGYDRSKGCVTAWHRVIEDGHHRCAVICAIYGPDYQVPVVQAHSPFPDDIDVCDRMCKGC